MLCETVLLAAALVTAKSPVDYVLPEMGTVNTVDLSTGNLYPLISLPWGGAGWTPQTQTDKGNRWFYDYTHTKICGIRETHQPSPWISDYGPWSFLPVVGKPGTNAAARASWFSHKGETIRPDWYVWSALGMYPVCPGSDEYALGLPLFDRAEVKLPNGKILRIVRAGDGLSGAASAEWNGTRLPSPFVSRTALRKGGELLFR